MVTQKKRISKLESEKQAFIGTCMSRNMDEEVL